MGKYIILAAVFFIVVGALILFSARRNVGRDQADKELRLIKNLHGPARCAKVCEVLEQLVERAKPGLLVAFWQDVEGLLLQALPDCPPDLKPRLRAVLEIVHERSDHRDTQRGVMDVRRSLLDD